ncbi:MAG: FeoB-associated Cys-rich membrane protein [Bacteroidia bacterium]|nr:FeoB-associated Cys-rich membrane protein [Bacteroidia bacterium]
MWQKIIVGVLLAAAVFYIARRIYNSFAKGEGGECADCPPNQIKNSLQKK